MNKSKHKRLTEHWKRKTDWVINGTPTRATGPQVSPRKKPPYQWATNIGSTELGKRAAARRQADRERQAERERQRWAFTSAKLSRPLSPIELATRISHDDAAEIQMHTHQLDEDGKPMLHPKFVARLDRVLSSYKHLTADRLRLAIVTGGGEDDPAGISVGPDPYTWEWAVLQMRRNDPHGLNIVFSLVVLEHTPIAELSHRWGIDKSTLYRQSKEAIKYVWDRCEGEIPENYRRHFARLARDRGQTSATSLVAS